MARRTPRARKKITKKQPARTIELPTDEMVLRDAVRVELEPDMLAWAKERADREGASLSAVLNEAVRQFRITEARQRWLTETATTASPEEIAEVIAGWVREDRASAA